MANAASLDDWDMATLAALQEANAEFCHAINLRDFRAYVEAGRLLTRAELQDLNAMTPFYSDMMDRDRGLFGHLFGNFGDFGNAFGFPRCLPNVYGPILIRWRWRDISVAEDLVITSRSAGVRSYDRHLHAVEPSEVSRMFRPGGRGYLETAARLYEVSFQGTLALSTATGLVVDPVSIVGRELFHEVAMRTSHLHISVLSRTYNPVDRTSLYGDICDHLVSNGGALDPDFFSVRLQEWWTEIGPSKHHLAELFCGYLYNGTLSLMAAEAVE
ncbi:MAG: hypothetical protein ACYC2H_08840 [Thermoplasmatota archaeon]